MKKILYNKRMCCEGSSDPRVCFCIGPENCNDNTCPLVKQHKEKQNEKNWGDLEEQYTEDWMKTKDDIEVCTE